MGTIIKNTQKEKIKPKHIVIGILLLFVVIGMMAELALIMEKFQPK
jgi:hypothetical protein